VTGEHVSDRQHQQNDAASNGKIFDTNIKYPQDKLAEKEESYAVPGWLSLR
jgi:hypothetical protein